ncbi:MAG: leucine-rich repeat protein, partial [Clostridiales bacterium]|nr:leucine-rich repeat protein [Clostridiales bacterium]
MKKMIHFWTKWTIQMTVSLLLVLAILLPETLSFAEAAEDSFDSNSYVSISYSYGNMNSEFYYNDSMLLGNANELSGELAKVSIGLSIAAYGEGDDGTGEIISRTLELMGFEVVYNNYNELAPTYEDNDVVAFSVGYKQITYDGVTYNAWVIPVRGTTGNCEWFSNFNLGERSDGYHDGFKKAADTVLNVLPSVITTDNNIILLTGHSRGAAVANIVAGELTESASLATSNHIFGYTFACPAVGKNVNTSLTNIRNFNNPGDVITALPLEEWGYERYGMTVSLYQDYQSYSNLEQRFEAVCGETYAGILQTESFTSVIKMLASSETEYNSDTNQLLFELAAWGLGENTAENLAKVLANHIEDDSVIQLLTKVILFDLSGPIHSYISKTALSDYYQLLADIDYALQETAVYTDEEMEAWISSSSVVSQIEETTSNFTVTCREDLVTARDYLASCLDRVSGYITAYETVYNLYFATDRAILSSVWHAHTPETYALWINTLYYGYEGWYGSSNTASVSIGEEVTTIGIRCFSYNTGVTSIDIGNSVTVISEYACDGCTALTSLTIGEGVVSIGPAAFYGCTALTELNYNAVSVEDFSIRSNVFCVAGGEGEGITVIFGDSVETIPGYLFYSPYGNANIKTVTIGSSVASIGDYAFRNCTDLETVEVKEGVTQIDAYAFYGCSGLTSVSLPGSIVEIGAYAFYDCTSLASVSLPESIVGIGDYAFCYCSSLGTIEIPDSVTSIGRSSFEWCTALTSLTLGEGVVSIGSEAFYGCTALTELNYNAVSVEDFSIRSN